MNSKKIIFCLFFSIFLISSLNAETIYKWVDEDGQVHYGSKANNKNAKKVKIKKHPVIPKAKYDDDDSEEPSKKILNSKERANKLKKYVDSIEAENKLKAEEKKKKEKQEKIRSARCKASKNQYVRAKNAGALYDNDEKGNLFLLNKKQYEQAMAIARARVQKWCQ